MKKEHYYKDDFWRKCKQYNFFVLPIILPQPQTDLVYLTSLPAFTFVVANFCFSPPTLGFW